MSKILADGRKTITEQMIVCRECGAKIIFGPKGPKGLIVHESQIPGYEGYYEYECPRCFGENYLYFEDIKYDGVGEDVTVLEGSKKVERVMNLRCRKCETLISLEPQDIKRYKMSPLLSEETWYEYHCPYCNEEGYLTEEVIPKYIKFYWNHFKSKT